MSKTSDNAEMIRGIREYLRENPSEIAPPPMQRAYALGDEDDDETIWSRPKNLTRETIMTAAQFVTGDSNGPFLAFAAWIVPEMHEGEMLFAALERLSEGAWTAAE